LRVSIPFSSWSKVLLCEAQGSELKEIVVEVREEDLPKISKLSKEVQPHYIDEREWLIAICALNSKTRHIHLLSTR